MPPVSRLEDRSTVSRAIWWVLSRPPMSALVFSSSLVLIGLLDLLGETRQWSVPVTGLLDEPAHVLTAALLLAAFLPVSASAVVPWVLAGAVLIDLDHIPLYLWGALASDQYGRPVSHSAATVVLLACAGAFSRGGLRRALLGLSLGVAMHLVRDLGTDPGVPLWWPIGQHSVLVPYPIYFCTMVVVAGIAAGRWYRRRPLVHAGP
jgi:inner membrane protein